MRTPLCPILWGLQMRRSLFVKGDLTPVSLLARSNVVLSGVSVISTSPPLLIPHLTLRLIPALRVGDCQMMQ